MYLFKKIANSDGEALRKIHITVKIKTTCVLYDTLYHVLIFITYEMFRLKKFAQRGK